MSPRSNRHTTALLAAVTALTVTCGHFAREPVADARDGAASARSAVLQRMAALELALAGHGYAPLPARLVADLAEGESCTLSFAATDAGRVVAVAVGDPEALSLDLTVGAGGDGNRIASDVSRGRRAAAAFPARKDEVYTITATASAGSGAAAVALFRAPLAAPPPPLATLFDADPAPRLTWPEIAAMLGADGYAPAGDPIDLEVGEADHRSFPFELRQGRCYSFAALGSPGVDAVALRVHGEAELLSADFAERFHAWAQLCAERDLRVRASISVLAGSGSVRLGVFAASRAQVAAMVGPAVVPAARPPTLEIALRRAGAEMERLGYGPAELLLTAEVATAGTRVEVPIPAGTAGCYALVAAAEDPAADVDLQVVVARRGAPGDRLEIADPSDGPDSRIAVCHGDDVQTSATLITVRGAGRVGIWKLPLPTIAIDAGGNEPPLAVREAAARLGRVGLRPVASGSSIRAEAGRCYGAIAFSPAGRISRLAVKERGDEEHATEWSGDSEGPEITWCAAEDGDYDLAATATGEEAEPPIIILLATGK